jgi:hypothetical protein
VSPGTGDEATYGLQAGDAVERKGMALAVGAQREALRCTAAAGSGCWGAKGGVG